MAESHTWLDDENGRPSNVRRAVVFAAMLMAVLLYLDRFCVGLAEPYIKQDLELSTFQIGFFFSAFFLTYALFQVPSGWLSDRFGARIMLVVYVLSWSLFTAMMGLSYGFVMLLLMRAAYGIGQAGAYPTSASVVSKWVPFSKRGTASSIIAFGGRFGGAIAPILTASLIVLFVPVHRSSEIDEDDLLDAAAMCSRLAPDTPSVQNTASAGRSVNSDATDDSSPKRSPAIDRIWSLVATEIQQRVIAIAERYRPVEPKIKELEKQGKLLQRVWRFFAAAEKFRQADELRITLDERDRRLLVRAMREIVDRRDFYRKGDFAELEVDRQARRFMQRLDDGETLSSNEMQRLNRLLLEACFPNELGKVYVFGWRPVMITYGLLGLLVAAVLWIVLRNRPEEHPRCNQAERELIALGRPSGAPGPHGKPGRVPWGPLLTSRSMWFSCIGKVGTNIGWVFLVTWFPRYLIEVHDVPLIERGWMASTPLFVGWLGMLGGGRLTDALVRKVGLRWGRRLPWSGSRFIGMAAFLACAWLDSPWAVTAALAVVAAATDLGTAPSWSFCQDVGGRYVGSVLGWGNMWGNLGATVSPILLAWLFDGFGWELMFLVCGGAYGVAAVLALGIDATIPIAPPDEYHAAEEDDQGEGMSDEGAGRAR